MRTAIKTFELQTPSVHSKFGIARNGNEMSLHNNRFMVSPLVTLSETRTAGPGQIQGLSSSQRLYALLPSVDVSGKNYYYTRLKQTKSLRVSALFSLRHVPSLQCNKDHIHALTQHHLSKRSEETSFKPVRSIWFVHVRVRTLKVLHTFIHTYTLILIITNAVLF